MLVKLTIPLVAKYYGETCAVGSLTLFSAKAVLYWFTGQSFILDFLTKSIDTISTCGII